MNRRIYSRGQDAALKRSCVFDMIGAGFDCLVLSLVDEAIEHELVFPPLSPHMEHVMMLRSQVLCSVRKGVQT